MFKDLTLRLGHQRRRGWRSLLRVVLLVVAAGCSKSGMTDSSTEPARTMANVSYGANAAQMMDIVLPAGRTTSTAVVVFIHGGGWNGGDKSFFTQDLTAFSDKGYATVNLNYRLASNAANVHDPLLSDDVTAALDFMAAHAAEYKVAASRFGLVGHSAGAHLALLAAYKYDAARRIKAVASLSGPADLNDAAFLAIPTIRATVEEYLGVTQAAQPARWTAASPVSVATATSPPTIIVHGLLDVLVPFTVAQRLDARLTVLGVAHEYDLFPGYSHDLGYIGPNRLPANVVDPVLAWFDRYVK